MVHAAVCAGPSCGRLADLQTCHSPKGFHSADAATKTTLDRTEHCFDMKPKRLAADTA